MSLLLSALYSIIMSLLGIGAAFVWGVPAWRNAALAVRVRHLPGMLLFGVAAVAVFGFAALSAFNLSAMLVIGAIAVETGVMP
jgi:hypothetical protein